MPDSLVRWMTPSASISLAVLMACVVLSALLWQEWAWRRGYPPVLPVPEPAVVQSSAQPSASPALVAQLFGLGPLVAAVPSAERVVLRGLFIGHDGSAQALVSVGDQRRVYQAGDALPGGSVIRRITAQGVVLWRSGREEVLSLIADNRPLLLPEVTP